MTSKAAIKRRKAASTAARAEENRLARERAGRTPSTPIAQPKERKGLEWLLHKKRITPKQFWAGTEYGNLYRAVAANGLEPLRSCINDERGGGGGTSGKIPGMSFADTNLDNAERLAELHTVALRSETNMIATLAAICGKQFTPREITTDHAETVEIETCLRLALNLLAAHLESERRAA
jgi:hypothetical protein